MHARKHQNTPDVETRTAKSEETPVLSSSNAATLEENDLASTGETSMLADAMHILGDAAPLLLPALPLAQLVELNPLADAAVAAEVMKHSADAIAEADPELAWQLVARCFPIGHGVEFGAEVTALIEGIPLQSGSEMALWHVAEDAGRIELERTLSIAYDEHAGPFGAEASIGLEQAADIEFDLEAAEVLNALGVAACFQAAEQFPLETALAQVALRRLETAPVTAYESALVAAGDADVVAREDLLAEVGPFSALANTLSGLQPELHAALEASIEAGDDLRIVSGPDGVRVELSISGSGKLGAFADSIPGLRELDRALWIQGEGSARVVANLLPGEGLVGPGVEAHLEHGFQGETEALVFRDLFLAAASLSESGDATDVGAAIEQSGLAGLTRSVTVELPKNEESEVLPGFVEHTELLGTDRELEVEASCRVSAAAVAPLFRGLTPPPGRTANEVALDALRACIDLTRGQRLPDWLGAVDPIALLAAFELDSPRIIGRVSRKASMGDEFEAGAEAAWLVDTPYEGGLDLDALWKRV